MSSGSAETFFDYDAKPDSLVESGDITIDSLDNVVVLHPPTILPRAIDTELESDGWLTSAEAQQDEEETEEINPPVYEVDAPKKYKKLLRIPLSAGEERQLSYRIKAGDRDARNQLIEAHMHLVMPLAKRFSGRGLDLLDLMQEGNMGLIRAAERWTPLPDIRFASYAIVFIRERMKGAIASKAGSIRVPHDIMLRKGKLYDVSDQWESEHGMLPTNEELSQVTGFTIPEIEEALAASRVGDSLNQELRTENGRGYIFGEFGDFLPDPQAFDEIDKIPFRLDRKAAEKNMTDRQKKAVFMRHDLGSSLTEMGRELYIEGENKSQTRGAFEMIAFHALEGAYRKLRK